MKQAEDTKTGDLLGTVRGRGRPVGTGSGSAMSDAERQRARRKRLKERGASSLTVTLPLDVLEALAKFVQFKGESQSDAVERILRDRLLRKR